MLLSAFLSTHDFMLFAAALLISLCLTTAALRMAPRWPAPRSVKGMGRTALSGGVLGLTVWLVFFVTWKGFFPFVAVTIPLLAMVSSLGLAVMGAIAALTIAVHGDAGVRGSMLAGSILAASASCLLFVIMSAIAAPLALGYNLPEVLLSMLAGTLLCATGLHQFRHASARWRALLPGALVGVALPVLDIASLCSILPFTEWETASATLGALALQPLNIVFLSEFAAILALTRAGAAVDRQSAIRTREENERLRQLTDSTFEGLLVHRDGIVLDANTAFCVLAGLPLDQVKDRPVRDFAPDFPERSGMVAVETRLNHAEGAPVPVEMLSRAINLGAGQVQVTAVRDIRERRAAEQSARDRQQVRDLRRENDEARERQRIAEETSRAKSAFLAMMSHEIRTPMNAVLGLASTLLEETLTGEQRRVVRAIHDSGDSLLRILNDILDFSRLDAGRMTFEPGAFSPAALTLRTLSVHGPVAAEKGVRLETVQDPALPPWLTGDAGRIGQVLHNLVSNAIKFTRAGTVTVEARRVEPGRDLMPGGVIPGDAKPGDARPGDAKPGEDDPEPGGTRPEAAADDMATVEWIVTDSGIGIAPAQLTTLFDAFVQADTSITRRFGGSGLGLAICKQLVEQMGGVITVASVPGAGSTFRFHLTLKRASEQDAASPEAPSDEALAQRLKRLNRPLRLLLAEDNAINKLVFSRMLNGLAIEIDIASDGSEAVAAAEATAYDMICMDMSMPEMDGLEATRAIRRGSGPCRAVPIIAMTANAFPEDVEACRAAGMNDFVSKPVSKPTLMNALLRAMASEEYGAKVRETA